MDYKIAKEEFQEFEKNLNRLKEKFDIHKSNLEAHTGIFRNFRMLLTNFYEKGHRFHTDLYEIERRTLYYHLKEVLQEVAGLIYIVKEDLRVKQRLQNLQIQNEKISAVENRDRTSAEKHTDHYKLPFYCMLLLLLTYLNFSVPYLVSSINWKYMIGIEVAIVTSIIIFYFKNVPGWLQFLVGTILAILAIFFN